MLKLNISKPIYKAVAISSFATLLFCGITTQSAFAETKIQAKEVVAGASVDPDFKKLDVNGNNKISLKEAVKDKGLAASFDITDVNKDGNITPDEYSSYKVSLQTKSLDSAAATSAPDSNPVN